MAKNILVSRIILSAIIMVLILDAYIYKRENFFSVHKKGWITYTYTITKKNYFRTT